MIWLLGLSAFCILIAFGLVADSTLQRGRIWLNKFALVQIVEGNAFRNIVTLIAVIGTAVSLYISINNQNKTTDRILTSQSDRLQDQLNFQKSQQDAQIAFDDEKTANNIWVSYREFEANNPDFAHGNADFDKLSKDDQIRYYALVERLLMSADMVVIRHSKDHQWRDAFIFEFIKHKKFILRDRFLKKTPEHMSDICTYRTSVRHWIARAFINDKQAYNTIISASNECETQDDA